jgi:antitoxin (DNA-binding transcriptional repressor) of toxin-antitoxin stability system
MIQVGIRLLKNRLGGYLDQVRRGETIVITDRGKPVARIERIVEDEELPEAFGRLIAEGRAADHGRPLRMTPPTVALLPGSKSLVDYVAEQRR